MQIAKREQRKISLISVIAGKAGGEAHTALIKEEAKEVTRKRWPKSAAIAELWPVNDFKTLLRHRDDTRPWAGVGRAEGSQYKKAMWLVKKWNKTLALEKLLNACECGDVRPSESEKKMILPVLFVQKTYY